MNGLEHELRALAPHVEWPDAPDVASTVAARAAMPRPRRTTSRRVGLVLAVLLLALSVALAVPPARTAIFDWLGIGSARIERVDELPPLQPSAPVALLGESTTLAEARRRAGFRVAPPPRNEPAPDEIRVVDGRRVSYLWRDGNRIRLLVTQVPGLLQRGEILRKLIPPSVRIEITLGHCGDAYLMSPEGALARAGLHALRSAFQCEPVLMREGGSIPIVNDFKRILGADTLLLGLALPDDNAHSPNEKFSLDCFAAGMRMSAALWQELG